VRTAAPNEEFSVDAAKKSVVKPKVEKKAEEPAPAADAADAEAPAADADAE
jgi:small subunit ribosomal protein S16